MKNGIVLFLFMIFSYAGFAQVSFDNLVGKWRMHEVYRGQTEVSDQYIPDTHRWIEFKSDYTFVSDGRAYGRREGRFILDEDTGLLSFDMELGFNQQSFWQVEFDGQKMIWTDKGNPRTDRIKIVLVPSY